MTNKKILTLVFVVAFLTLLVGCFPSHTPVITSVPVTTATVGETYTYDVNATDPDADELTYSLDIKPPGMTINSATGLIKWTPTAEGDYPVVVKASDGTLDITQSFTIVVSESPAVNQAPIIYSDPITTATIGVLYTYDVYATDLDGDDLTYSLTVRPKGMSINPATGVISWIPTAEGNYAVVVNVSDGALIDTQGFTLTVSAVEPGLIGIKVVPKTMALLVGESEPITSVTAHYSDGSTFVIDQQGDDCGYGSSDNGIAEVSVAGVVKAVAEGSATITVGYGGKTDTLEVTVSKPPAELTSLWSNLEAEFEPEFAPGVYEYSLAATYDDDKITIAATTDLEGATIEYTKKGTEMGEFNLFVGENIITITVKKDGYQTTTYTITVTRASLPVNNVNTGKYYATIQEAIDDVDTLAGHTIEVAAGTFNENIIIDDSLTIASVDGALVTIIDAQEADYGIFIIGASTVATFEGFTVKNYETIGILAGAFSPTEEDPLEVHILNNIVEEPGAEDKHNNCIQVGDGTTGTVIGNEVFGAWLVSPDYSGSGILVAGSSNVLVSENYVHDCEGGIQIVGYAELRDAPSQGNLIENNLVENCKAGISIQMNSIGTTIRYNDVLNNDTGIGSVGNVSWEMTIPSGTEIHYNNIFGNTNYGVKSSVWSSGDAEEVDATNNWWGHTSGPTHASNQSGTGDAVSDNVDFDPWSDSPN